MPEIGYQQRRLVLAICCLSIFVVGLDNTIANLALPAIQRDLHASTSRLQWTIDAYQLALATLMLLAGSMADRFGRRRVFQLGLGVFAGASLLCGLASDVRWLIAFRTLQGVGASMLNPVAMSIVRNTFPDARERARAFGTWSAVYGASMALGPVVGGALIQAAGWPSIFWINVPIGVATIALTARFVPESRAPRPRRFDPLGQLLVIVLLASLTFAIIQAPAAGWGAAAIRTALVVASLALAALLFHEPRRTDPLIEVAFFRSVPFSGATVIALCALAATGGFLFVNTPHLQDVRGYSPLLAALCTLPTAIATLLLAPAQFPNVFAADLPESQTRIMAVEQRPISASAFGDAPTAAAWHTIPSWALVAKQDKAIGTDLERFEAQRAGSHTVEVNGSHIVMISHPGVVTQLIEAAAKATAT